MKDLLAAGVQIWVGLDPVRRKGFLGKSGLFIKVHSLGSKDCGEPPDSGKQRRIRPFSGESRDFREFRDPRDFLQ